MKYFAFILFTTTLLLAGCDNRPTADYTEVKKSADIYPLYEGTYLPYNIAPLNYRLQESGDRFVVRFVSGTDSFEVAAKKELDIPRKKWKKLLEANKGKEMRMKIFSQTEKKWTKYNDVVFHIAEEPVDPYIAYRLIEPGYAAWNKMGIYQRCVENFEETPVMLNSLTDNNCMNCHSFYKNNPDRMLFHMRGANAGTIFAKDGVVKRVNTKAPGMLSAGVYPRWHPDGRYVAFSTNFTTQSFRTQSPNKIEVYDKDSDIVIYDTETDSIFTARILSSKSSFETFPEWSADGRSLYFCTTPAVANMPEDFESLLYDLVSVPFDPEKARFSNKADTLFAAHKIEKSVSIPRVSPDGKNIVFCLSGYGTFPIWHKDNDLYQLNMNTREAVDITEINSPESDSYHSWSSNGRWLLFSSRRLDGNYTRLFISYFDKDGKWHKPILLPQKKSDHYDFLVKSYNVPEFITGKVSVSPNEFSDAARKEAIIPKTRSK